MANPTTILTQVPVGPGQNQMIIAVGRWGSADSGAMDWVRFEACDIAIGLSGNATAVVAGVQRSATDPNGPQGALPSPADTAGFSGDLTTGLAPNIYQEAGVGWWRVNVTTNSGGSGNAAVSATLSGPAAGQ